MNIFHSVAFLAVLSAFFYCISMIAMKAYASGPQQALLIVIGLALVCAATFEVFALRQERLGMIYVGILAAEVVILGTVSLFQFDETYSYRELAGIAVVLLGTAIAWT